MRGITGWGGNLQSNSVRSWVLVSEEGEEEIIETQGVEQHGDGVGDGGVVHRGLVLAACDRQVHHG